MPFINYKQLHFRLHRDQHSMCPEYILELNRNFNVDPSTQKTYAKYEYVDCPGFVEAVLLWIKNDQKFAGMEMEQFIDSILTPDEIAQLNGMPIATQTNEIREE